MLTDRQRTLVRETWAQLVPIAPAAAALFYERLFEIAPPLRALFRHAEMDAQGGKLVQVLGFAVAHLDRLDTLAPTVEALGRRHAGYGVTDRDYAVVGEALLWTLGRGLGPAFTPEAEAAWATTFRLLAGIMRSAVSAGLAPTPAPPAVAPTTATARVVSAALVGLLVLASGPRAAAAQTIDTRNATPVVASTTLRFGQTFTTPAGATSLDRFAFWLTLTGDGGGSPAAFRALVLAWDGAQPVGPVLYASAPRAPSCCSPVEESFSTGGVPVVGGLRYVALVEQLAGAVAHARPGDAALEPADSYAGGGGVLGPCPPGTPLGDCSWVEEAEDRAFVAEFSNGAAVVPEPGTLGLVAVGLAAAAGLRRGARRAHDGPDGT